MAKIIITAGGTGGHVFPALALAGALTKENIPIHFVTDNRGQKFFPEKYLEKTTVLHMSGLGKRNVFSRFTGLFLLGLSCLKTIFSFLKDKPAGVVSFGGHATVPALLAARITGTPYVLHEQNAVLGRVNRFFAPKAQSLVLSFKETLKIPKGVTPILLGMPVRQEITLTGYPNRTKETPLNLLIIGGSQGTNAFDCLLDALEFLPPKHHARLNIVHQVRSDKQEVVQKQYDNLGISAEVAPFFHDMHKRLEWAHLVIARAGSSSVMEIASAGRPALFVPLPFSADDHQTANAKFSEEQGAAWCWNQKDLKAENLAKLLQEVLENPNILAKMSQNSAKVIVPHATEALAEHIQKCLF